MFGMNLLLASAGQPTPILPPGQMDRDGYTASGHTNSGGHHNYGGCGGYDDCPLTPSPTPYSTPPTHPTPDVHTSATVSTSPTFLTHLPVTGSTGSGAYLLSGIGLVAVGAALWIVATRFRNRRAGGA